MGNFLNPQGFPPERTLAFEVWWPRRGEDWAELCWDALRLTAAAMIAFAGWCVRSRLSRGWVTVLVIATVVLLTLGPIRLAEATSNEISSCSRFPGYQPKAGEQPRSWPALAAYYDARAWAGYSIRALALVTCAMLATRSLVTRWRHWLWTEWASFVSAAIIAGCWIGDEFYFRPALDRTVRITLLGASLVVMALIAGASIFACAAFSRRLRPQSEPNSPRVIN